MQLFELLVNIVVNFKCLWIAFEFSADPQKPPGLSLNALKLKQPVCTQRFGLDEMIFLKNLYINLLRISTKPGWHNYISSQPSAIYLSSSRFFLPRQFLTDGLGRSGIQKKQHRYSRENPLNLNMKAKKRFIQLKVEGRRADWWNERERAGSFFW